MKKIFQNLDQEILDILQAIKEAGGTGYLVGGCVRDQFFDHESKDIDIEVFGLEQEPLNALLEAFGKVDNVGESFGVTKLTTDSNDYDLNLPRKERKSGTGHQGFDIYIDPMMSLIEAGMRRDVTMNALYYDPLTELLVDNFDGVLDIADRCLRHVSPQFADDPLRVERLMQFAGRKEMYVDAETVEMCRSLIPEFGTISKERHWTEFEKLMSKGVAIEEGLRTLVVTGWSENYPMLHEMLGEYDGKLYHVGIRCNQMRRLTNNAKDKLDKADVLVLRLATLCYDMRIPKNFLEKIDTPKKIMNKVAELCRLTKEMTKEGLTPFDVKLLMSTKKHTTMKMFSLLARCILFVDDRTEFATLGRMLSRFTEEDLIPLVTGQDLLDRGWKPSKELGDKLQELFERQLRFEWSREYLLSALD